MGWQCRRRWCAPCTTSHQQQACLSESALESAPFFFLAPAGNQTDQMVRTGPADNLFAWLAPMTPPRWGKHGFRPTHDLRRMSRTWTIFFLMGTACMHAIAARDDPTACCVSTKTCAAMHAATTGFAPARPAAEPSGAHWSMSRRLLNFFCDRTSLRARSH